MRAIKTLLVISLSLLLVLIIVLAVNTWRANQPVEFSSSYVPVDLNESEVVSRFAGSLRFKTVSYDAQQKPAEAAFFAYQQYLRQAYPLVHQYLQIERISKYSLLYTWPGSDPSLPAVLLAAHQDVVPVDTADLAAWEYPPFAGEIARGFVWGRGALDHKLAVTAQLEALELLLERDYKPERTLLLSFGHDEEVGGVSGAAKIVELLQAKGTSVAFSLDEGSMILEGVLPGVSVPVALIGLAEKGMITVELSAEGRGGHSSRPAHPTAVDRLVSAIERLNRDPLPARLQPPVDQMFDSLISDMSLTNQVVISNRWLFEPLLLNKLSQSATSDALIRTTNVVTMIPAAGVKSNVIPERASVLMNLRLLPGDSVAGVLKQLRDKLAGLDVNVSSVGRETEASRVSDASSDAYSLLAGVTSSLFPDVRVAPGMILAGTDSKYYSRIADQSFRFTPVRVSSEDVARVHGVNERVSQSDYLQLVRFYTELLSRSLRSAW